MKKFIKAFTKKSVVLPVITMEEVSVTPICAMVIDSNYSRKVVCNELMRLIKKDAKECKQVIYAPVVYSVDFEVNACNSNIEYVSEVTEEGNEITIVIKRKEYKYM